MIKTPKDVKLFLDLAFWFGKKRAMTVNQFLGWFTSYLSTNHKNYIKTLVPFFMEEQQRAETTLCELLEKDYLQKKKIRTVKSKITRHVDWPRTYAKATPYLPIKYHSFEIQTQLDISLLGALIGIAEEWKAWLEKIVSWNPDTYWNKSEEIKNIENRALKLKESIDKAKKRGAIAHFYPLTAKHRQIILNFVKAEDKENFLKSLNRWSDYLVNDLTSAVKKVKIIVADMVNVNANLANLFEATCHLSILKAAIESCNWQLISIDTDTESTNSRTIYNLKRDDINFRLGKGNPKNLFKNSSYYDKSERMLQIRELSGQTGSGYQPDIVMGFYTDSGDHDDKNPHVIFGDAKRYPKSGIAGAYKSTIASTMIAYGHWGKLEIMPVACWKDAFKAPVQPFFTLFFVPEIVKQNETEKTNNDGNKQNELSTQDFSNQPVREFSLEQMQGKILGEWFNHITKQIEEGFKTDWKEKQNHSSSACGK